MNSCASQDVVKICTVSYEQYEYGTARTAYEYSYSYCQGIHSHVPACSRVLYSDDDSDDMLMLPSPLTFETSERETPMHDACRALFAAVSRP